MSSFAFKKFISSWLMPLPFSILLLAIGCGCLWFHRERIGRWMVTTGVVVLLLASSTSIFDHVLFKLERNYPVWHEQNVDLKYVVVMGSGNSDSYALPLTDRPDPAAIYRLLEGIAVYRANPGSKLILSGRGSHVVPHAEVMAQVASQLGVAATDIITQTESRDTEQEVSLLKPMIGNELFAVVTSAIHMPRTMTLFNAEGLHPLAVPTHFLNQLNALPAWLEFYVPAPGTLDRAEHLMHEGLGLLWLRAKQLF